MAITSVQRRYLDWLLDPRPQQPAGEAANEERYKSARRHLARSLRTGEKHFDRWERDPEFVAEWEAQIATVSGGPQRLAELLDGLYRVATGKVDGVRPADVIAATRLHLEVTGRHTPKQRITIDDPRLVRASDEELMAKARERNDRLARIGEAVDEVFELAEADLAGGDDGLG